jgi:hypothetical protein
LRKNPRAHHQSYCKSRECQQAWKNEWEKIRLKKDPEYKRKRQECKALWRKNRPGHPYQKEYRARHPDYTNRNKQSQRDRYENQKGQLVKSFKMEVLKTDVKSRKNGSLQRIYWVLADRDFTIKNIVNTDTVAYVT